MDPDPSDVPDDAMWLVQRDHPRLHHRSDPVRVFEEKTAADEYAEECNGTCHVSLVLKGGTED